MTIAIAWIRRTGFLHELIVASDSRLSSAGYVDICQKIFPLDRGDSFLAFCGDTTVAFPLIFQVQSAIRNYRPAFDRSEDVSKLSHRILELINSYRAAWIDTENTVADEENQSTRFIFGGWSWKYGRFFICPIQFNKKAREFRIGTHSKKVRRLQLPIGENCIAIGNYTAEFLDKLGSLIRNKNLKSLNYEPLAILTDMLKATKFTDRHSTEQFFKRSDRPGLIGGAPQAIKIYQHSNFRPIAIRWTNEGNSSVTLFGRRLFHYEKTLHPIYDTATGDFHYPLGDVEN